MTSRRHRCRRRKGVINDELASLSLTPAKFHGEWNYIIAPRTNGKVTS